MKFFIVATLASLAAVVILPAEAQERITGAGSNSVQAAPGQLSQGQEAMQNAAASNRYLFIFFWKEKNVSTDVAWYTIQAATPKIADWANSTAIQTIDPAEKQLVDRFGVSRAPMPLVLAIAPCGAVTKAFTGKLDENQLAAARVSPCAEICLKGLQDRKLVFLCVQNMAAQDGQAFVPQAVQDFQADEKYKNVTQVVLVNAVDQNEAGFLKDLQVDVHTPQPVSVLLAPPGSMIGKFEASATKQQIVDKLAAAQSGCCPGGKCGPNGCGPKK
ncbi:MAG TPA: hypothetical protein VIH42_10175 [Thermoguttaceae bacterium]